jgi:hypothetical protein
MRSLAISIPRQRPGHRSIAQAVWVCLVAVALAAATGCDVYQITPGNTTNFLRNGSVSSETLCNDGGACAGGRFVDVIYFQLGGSGRVTITITGGSADSRPTGSITTPAFFPIPIITQSNPTPNSFEASFDPVVWGEARYSLRICDCTSTVHNPYNVTITQLVGGGGGGG